MPAPKTPTPPETVVPVEIAPDPLAPEVIAGLKSILRLLPDAKRQTAVLSVNQWKDVVLAAEYLKGLVTDPEAGA